MNGLIIFFGNYLVYILLAVWLIFGNLIEPHLRPTYWSRFILAALIALVLMKVGGALYNDPRPFVVSHTTPLIPHTADNGFPSDHITLLTVIGVSIWPSSKKIAGWLLLGTLLVGFARIAAQIHHPLDVVGGLAIGLIAAGISNHYLRKA